jgi:hypothetical protein
MSLSRARSKMEALVYLLSFIVLSCIFGVR